jgi:hypothetical protein
MLWFILFGLIATVWVCYFAIPDLGVIGGTVVGLLMGACLGLALGLLGNLFGSIWWTEHYIAPKTVSLQSMAADSSLHGAFFLGIGRVDDVMEYHYFARQADGGFYEASAPVEDSTVYESAGNPHVEISRTAIDNIWMNALGSLDGKYPHYKFYVPKGSVVQTYTLKP